MKKPIASGRISERSGNRIVTIHMTTFASSSVRSGFAAQASPRDQDPADDEPEAGERHHDSPHLDGHSDQPVWVHQRHEHAAQEVVEGREQQQGEQARHEPDRADGAAEVDDPRRVGGWAGRLRGCGSSAGGRRRARSSTIAMTRSSPCRGSRSPRPLKTDVIANATPLAVPTSPFARSRPSSGTSSVTVVERATVRRLPAIAPVSTSTTNAQNAGLPRSRSALRRDGVDEPGERERAERDRRSRAASTSGAGAGPRTSRRTSRRRRRRACSCRR